MRLRLVVVAFGLALRPTVARGQTILASGAAVVGGNGGSRAVVQSGGRYFAFYSNGSQILYRSSTDGVTFSAPLVASTGSGATQFAVARTGSKIGLAWTNVGAGTADVFYREAAAGQPLFFGTASSVDGALGDRRGERPALLYSSTGVPVVAAGGVGVPIGGAFTPCGGSGLNRLVTYVRSGATWLASSSCSGSSSATSPALPGALAEVGKNVLAATAQAGALQSALYDADLASGSLGGELAEADALASNASVAAPELASVSGATASTDVHHLYATAAGGIAYLRQDGGVTGKSGGTVTDVTAIASSGAHPVLTRPAGGTGCTVLAWAEGAVIKRRSFSGTVASLSGTSVAMTAPGPITALTAEQEAAGEPAMTYQAGSTVYFGFLHADPVAPVLAVVPTTAPADGVTTIAASTSTLRDGCGAPLAPGALVTVSTTAGTIVEADADAVAPGVQVAVAGSGSVSFTVTAPLVAGPATLAALPVAGGTPAAAVVTFTGLDAGVEPVEAADGGGDAPDGGAGDGADALDAPVDPSGDGPDANDEGAGSDADLDTAVESDDASAPEPVADAVDASSEATGDATTDGGQDDHPAGDGADAGVTGRASLTIGCGCGSGPAASGSGAVGVGLAVACLHARRRRRRARR